MHGRVEPHIQKSLDIEWNIEQQGFIGNSRDVYNQASWGRCDSIIYSNTFGTKHLKVFTSNFHLLKKSHIKMDESS